MKGGYRIIDLNGNDFRTGQGVTIPGIYAAIEEDIGKPYMFVNYTISGIEAPAVFSSYNRRAGEYVFIISVSASSIYTLTFSDTDTVLYRGHTYTPVSPSADPSSEDEPSASI